MNNTFVYEVIKGDTLQGLAQKFNVSDWVDLAVINNLSPPFIVDAIRGDSTNDRVLFIGEKLLVPNSGGTYTVSQSNSEKVERETYGVDLTLTKNGDSLEEKFQLTDDGNGDLGTSTGKSNVQQACLIRLTLLRNSLHLHPELGSDFVSSIGKPGTEELMTKLALEISRTLKTDFRVDKVKDINVSKTSQGGVSISCKIIPIAPLTPFELVI